MNNKEFRVGNFVKVCFENTTGWFEVRVTEIFDDNTINTDYLHNFNISLSSKPYYFEPILLTEEWLIKFGFKYCEDPKFDEYANAKMYYYEQFQIGIRSSENDSHIIKHVCYIGGYPFAGIKYVHQAQNLMFSLTGDELKINEKTTTE